MNGTSTIKARIINEQRTTKFLHYNIDFFMTYTKAVKICHNLRLEEEMKFEDYVTGKLKHTPQKDILKKIQQPKTLFKKAIAPNNCNSCGVVLDNLGRCRCSY